MKKIVSYLKISYQFYSNNLLAKFLIRALLLFTIWELFYWQFRYVNFINEFYEVMTVQLTYSFLYTSGLVLKLFGYEIEQFGKVIRIVGTGGVLLDRGCLGRNLMGLFLGFMLMIPGNLKNKLWFIPAGLLSIYLMNVIRICTLAILWVNHEDWIPINHDIIFPRIVKLIIFLEWVIYFNWFRKVK